MDIKKLCFEVVGKILKAEDGHLSVSAKNRQIKRIAEWTMKELSSVELSTKSSYLSRIRRTINEYRLCGVDATLDSIEKLKLKHPELSTRINILRGLCPTLYSAWKTQTKESLRHLEKPKQLELIKVIDGLKLSHQIINMLVLDEVEYCQLEEAKKLALKDKKSNVKKIDRLEYLALIEKLSKSHKLNELMLCAAMATGRRMVEIIRVEQSFDLSSQQNHDNTILFGGQAKKRGIESESYVIPVIGIYVDQLITVLTKIAVSGNYRSSDNYKLNALYASKLNYTAKKYGLGEFKSTRAIYARIALEGYKLCGNQSVDDDEYVKSLLGHDDYAAGLHYKNITLI